MTQEYQFEFSGGRLCLDFVNTVNQRTGPVPIERLPDYRSLVSWARQAGVLSETESRRLARAAAASPQESARVLEGARDFREALHRIFRTFTDGGKVEASDLALVNGRYAHALSHEQLVPREGRYALAWRDDDALDRMLWPVARSAAELLVDQGCCAHVRRCLAEDWGCGWLFLDETRNHSRRWCNLDCSNRAKAHRHYQRIKKARAPSSKAKPSGGSGGSI